MKKGVILFLFALIMSFVSCEKNDPQEGEINRKVVHSNAKTEKINSELLVKLINELRTKGCNCPGQGKLPAVSPISWNAKLEKAAMLHSVDMHKYKQLTHEGSNGSSLAQRINNQGYKWKNIGENVAVGSTTEAQVIEQWKNSGGHCANMMSSKFTEIGIGRSGNYWTLILARPQ